MARRTFVRRLPLALLSALAVATFLTVALAEMPPATNAVDDESLGLSIDPVIEKDSIVGGRSVPLESKRRRLDEISTEDPDTPADNDGDDAKNEGDKDKISKEEKLDNQNDMKHEEKQIGGDGADGIDDEGEDIAKPNSNSDEELKSNKNTNKNKNKNNYKNKNKNKDGNKNKNDNKGNGKKKNNKDADDPDTDDIDTNDAVNEKVIPTITDYPTSGFTSMKEEIQEENDAVDDEPGIGDDDTAGNAEEDASDEETAEPIGDDANPDGDVISEGTVDMNPDQNNGNMDAHDGVDTEISNVGNAVTAASVESPAEESEPEQPEPEQSGQWNSEPEKSEPEIYYYDYGDDEHGGAIFIAFLVSIGLCIVCIKRKDQVMSIYKAVSASNGGGPGIGNLAKPSKYQPVASDESKDEEWGWGEDGNDGTDDDDNGDDDDDWGDDDWDDDLETSNTNGIEMTKPMPKAMALGSKSGSGLGSNRFHNATKTSLPAVPPKSTGSMASATSLTLPSSSAPSALNKSPMVTTTASSLAASNPPPPMAMNITSLGPKKATTTVAKPKKKKKLLGTSDEDLFATMGFGSPAPSSKPKPKASPQTSGGGRWAMGSTLQGGNTTFAKPPASYPAKTSIATSVVGSASTPGASRTPAPAPALIPDGFGDDDDLNLSDDDNFGFGDTDDAGGDDNWGDGDDDLDDLLND